MSRAILTFFAGASLTTLSGCGLTPAQIHDEDPSRLQIRAAEVTAELKIDGIASEEKLSDDERNAVRYFADAYRHEGHGKVVISRPSQGTDDVAALRVSMDARAILLAQGLDPAAIAEGPYDASGARAAPLVITYKTWEARVPGCPDISGYQMGWTGTNGALPSFGCAVQTDLAAQIANPGDLVGKQTLQPGDVRRRTVVIAKYRAGEPTAATRSESASGAISKAVGQ